VHVNGAVVQQMRV